MKFKYNYINLVLIIAILLTILLTLSSCEEKCPEINIDDLNAFNFQFKTTGNNSFTIDELDSIFIVRYLDIVLDSFSFPQDTFDFTNGILNFNEQTIRLSQGQPFNDIPPPYFPDYKYKILSRNQDFEFRIEQIELVGSYVGECEYVNSRKALVFNGDSLDFIAGVDEFILLEKP